MTAQNVCKRMHICSETEQQGSSRGRGPPRMRFCFPFVQGTNEKPPQPKLRRFFSVIRLRLGDGCAQGVDAVGVLPADAELLAAHVAVGGELAIDRT